MASILIVEDDLTLSLMLKTWLSKKKYTVASAIDVKEAKKKLKKRLPDLVLSDLRLPDGDGISLLKWIKQVDTNLPVIMMTSYAEIGTAVKAIKSGAFDYVAKPLNIEDLHRKIEMALTQEDNYLIEKQTITPPIEPQYFLEERKNKYMEGADSQYVEGQSLLHRKLHEYIDLVSPTNMSVFILGESGVGKERVARLIHEKSHRAGGAFVAVDCGVLSKELSASEFFGHIKGSFTGAINNKDGYFLIANGGTIFLDEVGNLTMEVQIQLLRVLQERKIRPVGSEKDIPVDVRVIAATNEKIDVNVPNPSFRLDLYHRLSEFVLYVPALRESKTDIPVFLNHFLKKSNEELNKNIAGFDADVIDLFTEYEWKGNLREMKNIVNRMVLIGKNQYITKDLVPENMLN
jgi:two-component system response regulator HydG